MTNIFDSERWVFELHNDWKQLWGKWNWYAFTFINVYFERDKMVDGWEFTCALLGLGFRIRYNTDAGLKKMSEWMDDWDTI